MQSSCHYCGVAIAISPSYPGQAKVHFDHYVPSSKGGADELFNIVPSCSSCNLLKSDMAPEKWAEQCHDHAVAAVRRLAWLIGFETAQEIASAIENALRGVGHYCPECRAWHVSSLLPADGSLNG